MKNLRTKLSYAIYILLVAFIFACTNTSSTNVKYHVMSNMLDDCDCYAIVVATGKNDGYLKAYENFMLVRDRQGKTYTYQGTRYNFEKGDTIFSKNNCN